MFNKSQEFPIESSDIKTKARFLKPITMDLLMNIVNNQPRMTQLKTNQSNQILQQKWLLMSKEEELKFEDIGLATDLLISKNNQFPTNPT